MGHSQKINIKHNWWDLLWQCAIHRLGAAPGESQNQSMRNERDFSKRHSGGWIHMKRNAICYKITSKFGCMFNLQTCNSDMRVETISGTISRWRKLQHIIRFTSENTLQFTHTINSDKLEFKCNLKRLLVNRKRRPHISRNYQDFLANIAARIVRNQMWLFSVNILMVWANNILLNAYHHNTFT